MLSFLCYFYYLYQNIFTVWNTNDKFTQNIVLFNVYSVFSLQTICPGFINIYIIINDNLLMYWFFITDGTIYIKELIKRNFNDIWMETVSFEASVLSNAFYPCLVHPFHQLWVFCAAFALNLHTIWCATWTCTPENKRNTSNCNTDIPS